MTQNGGISTDSLLRDFEIEFTPVQRENARSRIRKLDVQWDNYMRFIGDSIIGSGFKTRHQYSIVGREYTEQLTDLTIVDTRSEEHTSELQSRPHLVCRLLLEKRKQ